LEPEGKRDEGKIQEYQLENLILDQNNFAIFSNIIFNWCYINENKGGRVLLNLGIILQTNIGF
jgi:hypothetical protein